MKDEEAVQVAFDYDDDDAAANARARRRLRVGGDDDSGDGAKLAASSRTVTTLAGDLPDSYWRHNYEDLHMMDGVVNRAAHVAYIRSMMEIDEITIRSVVGLGFGLGHMLRSLLLALRPHRLHGIEPSREVFLRGSHRVLYGYGDERDMDDADDSSADVVTELLWPAVNDGTASVSDGDRRREDEVSCTYIFDAGADDRAAIDDKQQAQDGGIDSDSGAESATGPVQCDIRLRRECLERWCAPPPKAASTTTTAASEPPFVFDLAVCMSVLQYIDDELDKDPSSNMSIDDANGDDYGDGDGDGDSPLDRVCAGLARRCKYLYLTVPTDVELRRQRHELRFSDGWAFRRPRSLYMRSLGRHFTFVSARLLESKRHFDEQSTQLSDLLFRF